MLAPSRRPAHDLGLTDTKKTRGQEGIEKNDDRETVASAYQGIQG